MRFLLIFRAAAMSLTATAEPAATVEAMRMPAWIERGAQRGGSLVKQLMHRLTMLDQDQESVCGETPDLAGVVVAVTAQEPSDGAGAATMVPRSAAAHAAPVFSRRATRRTHMVL